MYQAIHVLTYFHHHFMNKSWFVQIKMSFIPTVCLFGSKSSYVQITTWRRKDDKPLSEAMMAYFYGCIYASLSLDELNKTSNYHMYMVYHFQFPIRLLQCPWIAATHVTCRLLWGHARMVECVKLELTGPGAACKYMHHLVGYFSAFWSSSRWPRAT